MAGNQIKLNHSSTMMYQNVNIQPLIPSQVHDNSKVEKVKLINTFGVSESKDSLSFVSNCNTYVDFGCLSKQDNSLSEISPNDIDISLKSLRNNVIATGNKAVGTRNNNTSENDYLILVSNKIPNGQNDLIGDYDGGPLGYSCYDPKSQFVTDEDDYAFLTPGCDPSDVVIGTNNRNRKEIGKQKSFITETKVNKYHYCPSCPYCTEKRDKLDKHIQKHVILEGYHPCGKKRHSLNTPAQRHRHNAEEYKCSICLYTCTVVKAYKKHRRMHILQGNILPVKLSCKICGKDRNTEKEMEKHMKKHQKDKYFLCDLCNFTNMQLKKIIQHRRKHTGEKPHLCPHCNSRSSRRDNLRSHVRRMHSKENMYIDTFDPTEKNQSDDEN